MDHDSKYLSQIILKVFNCLYQRPDDSYYDTAELTVDENSYNCFSCPQFNKPPPPYPFHKYAPNNQISSTESINEENIFSPSSSNLWSDYELTSVRPFVEWDGTSDSEWNAPLPPPPAIQKATTGRRHGTVQKAGKPAWTATRLCYTFRAYKAPNGVRMWSGLQLPTTESSTQSFFPEPAASRLHYSQPRLERDTDLNGKCFQ
ncbi:hypothetical protein TNIN_349741 [Trichonephila inaurata madagascariensis]|uniref:Uncharacterized protein n=1 Tax=Trichonephila inaurata madagascariensis TaxID=2747483 RepID=A0A8X6WY75_9ARAC|nr:hypothetical protein TNIN_349741 [Trichonephila inaurata madagascariensis]